MKETKEAGKEEAQADRCTKEVQAESVAYVVMSHFGLDTSDYSFGYVASWAAGQKTKALKDSLAVIQKTAQEIIDKLDPPAVAEEKKEATTAA